MKIYKIEFLYHVEIIKTKCYPNGKEFTQEDLDQLFIKNKNLYFLSCYDAKGNGIYAQWDDGEWAKRYYNDKNECVKTILDDGNIYYPLGEQAYDEYIEGVEK